MVKILAIGDFHGKFPEKLKKEARNVDLILCTGDFGGSDRLLKIIFKYFYEDWTKIVGDRKAKELILEDYKSGKYVLNELNKIGKKVYIIPGNWDFEGKRKNPMNGKHVGFMPYTEYIKKFQPRIFICGHMHEYQGIKKLGKTLIITTGSAKEGKAVVIDLDNKNIKVKFIK